jgi:hydrogenase maturation protease
MLIGYGNTLRGDDALGVMAIERLRPLLPDAEFVSVHQLTPELAQQLTNCDLAVFIDATYEDEPGKVQVERLPAIGDAASLTHHVNPAALLELARSLYGRAPEAMLVTGTGAGFETHEGLSEKGNEALQEICRLVPLLVRDFPAMW